MDRRTFLRRVGVIAGAGVTTGALAACGEDSGIPDTAPTLSVLQSPSYEILTGAASWVTFGVRDADNEELTDEAVEVYLRRADPPTGGGEGAREILAGPLEARYAPIGSTGIGVYWMQVEIDEPGFVEIVVVAGGEHGAAALRAVDAAESVVPAPGDPAIAAATPTDEEDLGYFAVCTQNPPCGMHEMSLDDALATGRPVALVFATPQFCQTVVCGPAVETVDAVRQDGTWGDTVFIHSEIYAEDPSRNLETAQLAEAVERWGLPSEPWFFAIDPEGTVVDRLDGPMVPEIIETMLGELSA